MGQTPSDITRQYEDESPNRQADGLAILFSSNGCCQHERSTPHFYSQTVVPNQKMFTRAIPNSNPFSNLSHQNLGRKSFLQKHISQAVIKKYFKA